MMKNTKIGNKISSLIGNLFSCIPFNPNFITFFSIIFAFIGFLIYEFDQKASFIMFIFFILAFFLDALDGAIAKIKKLVTKEGAFLDGISDRIVEFLLILTFFKIIYNTQGYIFQEDWLLLSSILFFGTFMTSFVKVYAHHHGLITYKNALKLPGILERAERSILLIIALGFYIFSNSYIQTKYILIIIAFLSLLTFIQRFYLILKK